MSKLKKSDKVTFNDHPATVAAAYQGLTGDAVIIKADNPDVSFNERESGKHVISVYEDSLALKKDGVRVQDLPDLPV